MAILGKEFNPVNPYTDAVDVYTTIRVVEEAANGPGHVVRFCDGSSARVGDNGAPVGYTPVKYSAQGGHHV
jgi:hypothetical protein